MKRIYGVWLLTRPTRSRAAFDPAIWRENPAGYATQTQFQRGIGIRYSWKHSPRFPDSEGGFMTFARGAKPNKVSDIVRTLLGHRAARPTHICELRGAQEKLTRATACAVLWSPRIRLRSSRGARLVATVRTAESAVKRVRRPDRPAPSSP